GSKPSSESTMSTFASELKSGLASAKEDLLNVIGCPPHG
ncbi:hypothetical protein CEXT_330771, partial [Caerostris extrusa]